MTVFDDLAQLLMAHGIDPRPCLVVRETGVDAPHVGGPPWVRLAGDRGGLTLALLGAFNDSGGVYSYNFAPAGDALVALYEELESAAGDGGAYSLHIALVLPDGVRILDGPPWGTIYPGAVWWSPTSGAHVSRRQLTALAEHIAGNPESCASRSVADWLRGFARARGVLLDLDDRLPIGGYALV